MNEQDIKTLVEMQLMISKKPQLSFEILAAVIEGLKSYGAEITKRNSYIDLIVRNLKPEYWEELKKYVVPEVFESLGLEAPHPKDNQVKI